MNNNEDVASPWQPIDTAPKTGIILLGWRCWNRSGDPDWIPIPGHWDTDQRTWMDATKWPHEPVNNPDYWMPIPSIPGDSI